MRPTNASLAVDKTQTRKLEKTSSRNRERFINQLVAVIFANNERCVSLVKQYEN
jgi:hypothetical protein